MASDRSHVSTYNDEVERVTRIVGAALLIASDRREPGFSNIDREPMWPIVRLVDRQAFSSPIPSTCLRGHVARR